MRFTVAAALMATSAIAVSSSNAGAMTTDAVMTTDSQSAAMSTDYTTERITITSCGPEVTNCPARSTKVSTNYIPLTTLTVYATNVHTVISCGPEVTNCPAHSTVLTTDYVAIYTTICPVTATEKPTAMATYPSYHNNTAPGAPASVYSSPVAVSTNQAVSSAAAASPPAPVSTYSSATECLPMTTQTVITKTYTTVLTSLETSNVVVPCPSTVAPPSPSASMPSANNSTSSPGPVTAGAASYAGSAVFAAIAGVAAFVLA